MNGIKEINGDEGLAAITEWYTKTMIKLESCVPGARAILEWTQTVESEIKATTIDQERPHDASVGHRLNRELILWRTGVSVS